MYHYEVYLMLLHILKRWGFKKDIVKKNVCIMNMAAIKRYWKTINLNPFIVEHKSIFFVWPNLATLTEELTAKEHGQPLCTQKLVHYIHSSSADYVAVLKMPTKSWTVDVPEAAGFYSALRSRRRKVKQSTEVRESQSQQMQMENTVMNTIQQTICMKKHKIR